MRGTLMLAVVVAAFTACRDDEPSDGASDVAADSAGDSAQPDATGGDTEDDTEDDTEGDTGGDTGVPDTAADTGIPDTVSDTAVDTAVVGDTGDTTVADTTDTADTAADTEVVATTCGASDECGNCAFPTKVTKVDECYCVFCASTPLTQAQCADNQASWSAHCEPWPGPGPCPVASCIPGPTPLCDPAGQCVADPNGCFFQEDCGSCRFSTPPPTPADCHCPTCPLPLSVAYCDQIEQTVSELCADFDFAACPRPPCAFPPPIICGPDQTCGYGQRDP